MDWVESFAALIRTKGWAVTCPVIPSSVLRNLADSLAGLANGSMRGGMRNLLDLPCVRELAQSDPVRTAASSVLGHGCFAVRGLLFDKPPEANWRVPWHQDLTIAVRERREIDGFGPWSVKAGVSHVQAPQLLLERMLAVRVHLDDCGAGNGPLRFIPGSHSAGILRLGMIETWIAENDAAVGLVAAGAILGFRPLLLHASSSASEPSHRRVIHLEFAAFELPGGLEWHWQV